MSTPSKNNQMHNDIMAAGSRERPPMLEPAREMWLAIERLQQGEFINKQDVKTKLFWEFGKFTSRDGESIESYYSRFYKMMNEMVRSKLKVDTMQVNVQFLQQLRLELSRFITIVKQQQDLDTLSYHRLFDILKQHQNEVNEIRDEKIDRNANPLELVVAAQQYPDNKEIAKPITTLSKSAFEEESDPEQAQRYKDTQKNLALITKYIKNIYKPTNNNLRTSSNTRNKTLDTSSRSRNERQPGYAKHGDWLADTDEEPDEQELEAHYMYMTKIQEVPTADSGPTYDAEPLEKVHLDDHYNVFTTNSHHFEQPESINDTCMVETVDSNVILGSSGMYDNEGHADQNTKNPRDEHVFLASFIANFKLDLDKNKKSQRQLKKANTPITQELNKSKQDLEKTKQDLEKSKQDLEKTKQDLEISKQNLTYFKSELEKYKIFQMNHKDKAKTELECARALSLGKSSFANPLYLKQAQNEKPCLYNVKYDKNDLSKLFAPEPDETIRRAEESRSKLCKTMRESVKNEWQNPITHDVKLLVKDTLMPVTLDTKSRALLFETQLKTEMFVDLKYVQSLEREVDELQTDKYEFSKEYNLLLQECVSKDIMCSILCSFESLDEKTELQSLFLEKVEEYLKAQLQDKNIAISKLKKLIQKMKGKYVDTKFEEPSVFQEPNAFKFQKPSVLEKPTPFSNSPFPNSRFSPTTNVNQNLSKPVTPQILPQSGEQAIRNMNVIK
ncbi:hypothetical protein Tco_0867978 [Tanacetum coccineum]